MANHCLTTATCECGPGRHAARRQASDQVSIDSQALHTRCPYKRQTRQAFTSSRLGGSSRSRPNKRRPRTSNGETSMWLVPGQLLTAFGIMDERGFPPLHHLSIELVSHLGRALFGMVLPNAGTKRAGTNRATWHTRPKPCPHRPPHGCTRVYIGPWFGLTPEASQTPTRM